MTFSLVEDLPEDQRLFLDHVDLQGEDFSDRKLEFRVSRLPLRRLWLRAHPLPGYGLRGQTCMSYYVDCSFDRSRLQVHGGVGCARFERCSFEDVELNGWSSHRAEFIDCTFSGRMRTSFFNGTVMEKEDRRALGRKRNEFHGNHFSRIWLR